MYTKFDIFDNNGNVMSYRQFSTDAAGNKVVSMNLAVDKKTHKPLISNRMLFDPDKYTYYQMVFDKDSRAIKTYMYEFKDGSPSAKLEKDNFPIASDNTEMPWDLFRDPKLAHHCDVFDGNRISVGDLAMLGQDKGGWSASAYVVRDAKNRNYTLMTRPFSSFPDDFVYRVELKEGYPCFWYELYPYQLNIHGKLVSFVDFIPVKYPKLLSDSFQRLMSTLYGTLLDNVPNQNAYMPIIATLLSELHNRYLLNRTSEE